MMRNTLVLLAVLCTGEALHAQIKDSALVRTPIKTAEEFGLLVAFNQGSSRGYGEIGFSKNICVFDGHHPTGIAITMSSEIQNVRVINSKIGGTDETVVAPKISAWAAGGASAIAMGINELYYTNFKVGCAVIRPEIGFGIEKFKLVYGYNIVVTNRGFIPIDKHIITIAYCFKLKAINYTN